MKKMLNPCINSFLSLNHGSYRDSCDLDHSLKFHFVNKLTKIQKTSLNSRFSYKGG